MPELPEVETTRRGIEPHLINRKVVEVIIRNPAMRWPVPENLANQLQGHTFKSIGRRAKYLLLAIGSGTLMIHLGMSGRLRIVTENIPVQKHDHLDICLDNKKILRFTDPRRFGSVLWIDDDPLEHLLLRSLGPEPLSDEFNAEYLFARSRHRKVTIKQFLMEGRIVVGVGNIYANEALFMAGIRPARLAGKISQDRYARLVDEVKAVLSSAIEQGGTTLRDFVSGDGKPGYFQQSLYVYGREGMSCKNCNSTLKLVRLGQRATVYCPQCQR